MNNRSGTVDIRIFIGALIVILCIIGVIAMLHFDATGRRGGQLGSDFEYNIDELSKIDPNLIIYKEDVSPINTGFSITHAVAADEIGKIMQSVCLMIKARSWMKSRLSLSLDAWQSKTIVITWQSISE